MTAPSLNDFGVVPEHGDSFEFWIDSAAGGVCRLVAVDQTERGARRSEIAEISGALWRKVGVRAARELAQAMSDNERSRAAPKLKSGANRLSPLVGRELALLLWALHEEGAEDQHEAILHGWRELAREERWWLFGKAAAPGQHTGTGWRRALFHALSEAQESRAEPPATKKKSHVRVTISRARVFPRLTPPRPTLSLM
ncbi:DUF3780 domain-containing protein [Caballeronia sp. LZ008]|uniref:DUF3780 domain-containing protein n=1 Tax=unclassified Caballeronia TaxID=2646786 RepID=UPI002027CD08|nr:MULTISPECIES: DUF3780 domain-containing protein [unclassified Caballeronia]MDR5794498.1 DUF3780 domain-containing protein [Caballeronia sp. LZ008]